MDSGERGMNPVTMIIINPWKEYWPSRESNQRPPVLKSASYRLSYGAGPRGEWKKNLFIHIFSHFPTKFFKTLLSLWVLNIDCVTNG